MDFMKALQGLQRAQQLAEATLDSMRALHQTMIAQNALLERIAVAVENMERTNR